MSYVGDGPQAGFWCPEGFWGPEGHRQEARAVKMVKVSGWVAKLAWDQTVGGVHCTVVVHRTQSLQTGSQLGPDWQEG